MKREAGKTIGKKLKKTTFEKFCPANPTINRQTTVCMKQLRLKGLNFYKALTKLWCCWSLNWRMTERKKYLAFHCNFQKKPYFEPQLCRNYLLLRYNAGPDSYAEMIDFIGFPYELLLKKIKTNA